MTVKEQEALFRRALSLHEQDSDEATLRAALAVYEEAKAAAPLTLPLAYNTGTLCLELAQRVTSPNEAHDFRFAAARNLDAALAISADNLEAIIAKAVLEDDFARSAKTTLAILSHRQHAVRLLEHGAVAAPSDPSVRLMLAEALVHCAEAMSDHNASDGTIQGILGKADGPIREAAWLIDAKTSDLSRMGTDAGTVQDLYKLRASAAVTRAKVVLAVTRLADVQKADAVRELQQAIDSLRAVAPAHSNFEIPLLQAELLEVLSEQETGPSESLLEEAIALCQTAISTPEAGPTASEHTTRRFEAAALLGDLCLARVRSERDKSKVAALVGTGMNAYESVIRAAEDGSKSDVESETWYNLACLLSIGMSMGIAISHSEQDLGKVLKHSVDAGGVSAEDLKQDADLAHVRSKKWFEQLLQYTSRKKAA